MTGIRLLIPDRVPGIQRRAPDWTNNNMADTKNIYNFTVEELSALLAELGEPEYRARQIFGWLYKKHAFDFNKMANLPAGLRRKLATAVNISAFFPEKTVGSADGTKKL